MELTPANKVKLEQFQTRLRESLEEVLQPGFYGSLSLDLEIADGTIQWLSSAVNRKER